MGIEIIFITGVIILQVYVFLRTRNEINRYETFFPNNLERIKIQKIDEIDNVELDEEHLDKLVYDLTGEEKITKNLTESKINDIDVIILPNKDAKSNPLFSNVIKSTNAYLIKNKGASADFNILQDISERHLENQENKITSLINVPLFIGLAGTFVGIIFGLWGIDFMNEGNLNSDSVQKLLNGVIGAMFASLAGLTLTVVSSAVLYRRAVANNDYTKNKYYDLIQRELLPVLNIGMAGSLTNFRSVLDHFIIRFSENIEGYSKSAEKLNENLNLQHEVLKEINKMKMVTTANKIADVFKTLNKSSKDLEKFKEYTPLLNENVEKFNDTITNMESVITNFDGFTDSLKTVGTSLSVTMDLQKQFKDSLELHFPTIKPAQEVWRGHVDDINKDIKEVYGNLNDYFEKSTKQIQQFVENNENFYDGLTVIQNSIKLFGENSKSQLKEHQDLRSDMNEIKIELQNSNESSLELNKDLVDAIKNFSKKIDLIAKVEKK